MRQTLIKSDAEWAVLDDISDVDNEVAKFLRRIKAHAHAQVKLEHSQADLEKREPKKYSQEDVKQLLRVAAIQLLGGVTRGELEPPTA